MTYKVIKSGEPKYLAELLSPLASVSDVALRSGDDPYRLSEPRAVQECSFAVRSFIYTAPRLYNRLPVYIKHLTSVDAFKKQLKTFLFMCAYDSADGTMTEDYRV